MTLSNDLPASVLDQQYSRCAPYLSHLEFAQSHINPLRGTGRRAIEFGGSNGFIKSLFDGIDYEVAPNAPAVDVQDLSAYADDSYDFVVLDEILEHVPRPWIATKEVHRILKPGGWLITSSPFMIAEHKVPMDYWRFTKDGLRILLTDFAEVDVYSWGNASSVTYLMSGMMVTTSDAIAAGAFDLSDKEKFAISVWAYAWKQGES